jgi:hypothetical protein
MEHEKLTPLLMDVIRRVALKQALSVDEELVYLIHMKKSKEARQLNSKAKKFPV